ncbi:MAG TPA: hypothetical protein VFI42_15915 [Thermomicrobiaceae bacterium]|nr:hypothetical protein [Thermomicrobiaceae bacterium]
MIAEIIATLGLIIEYIDDHPEVAKMLAEEAQELLGKHKDDKELPGREAMRGLAAGMAASNANAVQAYARAKAAAK